MSTTPIGILCVFLAMCFVGHADQSQPRAPVTGAASAARARFFKDSRQILALARAEGLEELTLVVAARPGANEVVAQRAAALGGMVRYRDDDVSYLRVKLPLDQVNTFAEHEQIESIAVRFGDGAYPARLPASDLSEPGDGVAATASLEVESGREPDAETESQKAPSPELWPPKAGDYPLRHPYTPLKDMDGAAFLADHPTWDGRGVTVAILDGNYDLLLPELQTAYTTDGTPVAKTADFLTSTDPRDDYERVPQWVDMRDTAEATGGRLTYQDRTFTAPRDGVLRVGFFSERRFNRPANGAYLDQDIDRNGNPKGDDGLFGVLWDEETNDVWVDTNRDLSFADERAMTNYITRQDIGIFGTDDPDTPIRESIGFTVQTNPGNKFVSINVGLYQHSTTILGALAANRHPAGRFVGVAPGVRLVSIYYGSMTHSLIEGLIVAFKHPLVDIVLLSQHTSLATHPYLLADARHPISIIAQRLIELTKKPLFVPGSNSPGLGLVGEDGLAPDAISVGGYQHKDSYRTNFGFVPAHDDNMHYAGLSHGPTGLGALKPDVLAPTGHLGNEVGYRDGQKSAGLYQLPPGVGIGRGTSTATPTAVGAAALLISAAKQTGIEYDARRLKAALTGSARYIPRLGAHEQGHGLVQVAAAWQLLKALQSAPPITIASHGPVKTRLSQLLATPHQGTGLYEREGWSAGDRGERTVSFTRTSGPATPMAFSLTWQGSSAFSSPESVTLPLDEPVTLPVTIAVDTPGVHSAVVTLRHPSLPGPAYRLLATVIAALRFPAESGYTAKADVQVPRPGDLGVFVDVPPGATALSISTAATDGAVRLGLISPYRESIFLCAVDIRSVPATQTCSIPHPTPGVWEINLWNGQDAFRFDPDLPDPVKPTPVTLTAKLIGFDVTLRAPLFPGLEVDRSSPLSLTMTNRFAPTTAAAVSVALGSAHTSRRTIASGEQHVSEMTVPAGTTALHARVTTNANTEADLDLYLLYCGSPTHDADATTALEKDVGICTVRAKSTDVGSINWVEVDSPAAGRWVAVVDAFRVPGGPTDYSYLDVFTHPRFGIIAIADIEEKRASGAQWTAKGSAWVASVPDIPRRLHGLVRVRGSDVVHPLRGSRFEVLTGRSWLLPLGSLDLVAPDSVPAAPRQ
ncbi:MAG: S8 family serine peptidase [Luteitalea sp.]|nr:S8 family serine peptidase [Luteitalea sp.]